MESTNALLIEAQGHLRAGRAAEAERVLRAVLAREPNHVGALSQTGLLAHARGDSEEAERLLRRAAELAPGRDVLWNNLGVIREALGKHQGAAEAYAAALALSPNRGRIHFNLGNALRNLGRVEEAIASFRHAVALEPEHAPAWHNFGALLAEVGEYAEAEPALREAVLRDPQMADAWVTLGAALQSLDREEEALAAYRRARALRPECPAAAAAEAGVHLRRGAAQEAADLVCNLLGASPGDDPDVAVLYASVARKLQRESDAVAMIERALRRPELPRSKRQALLFSLGNLRDQRGEFAEAFAAFREANALALRRFDFDRFAGLIDDVIAAFPGHTPPGAEGAAPSSTLPVFVVGMPRSGTSLVEQILATHPEVFGAGELPEIERLAHSLPQRLGSPLPYPRCLAEADGQTLEAVAAEYLGVLKSLAPEAARVVDKMPGNFVHLGFLSLLFPRARIVHVQRDPLDTCLSCYFQQFSQGHEYASDLGMLGRVYRQYQRLMRHWRDGGRVEMLDVRYEELVQEPERETRRLLEWCGLEWDARCLRFYENPRPVRTASFAQVRQPIHTRSVERRRRYAEFLGPMREALETD